MLLYYHFLTKENYCHFATRVLSEFHNSSDRVSDDFYQKEDTITCRRKQKKYKHKTVLFPEIHVFHAPYRLLSSRDKTAPQHMVTKAFSPADHACFSSPAGSRFLQKPCRASNTFRTGGHGLSVRYADFADAGKDTVTGGSAFHSSPERRPLGLHAALDNEAGTVLHESLSRRPQGKQAKSTPLLAPPLAHRLLQEYSPCVPDRFATLNQEALRGYLWVRPARPVSGRYPPHNGKAIVFPL